MQDVLQDAIEIGGIYKFQADHYAVGVEFAGDSAAFVLAESSAVFVSPDNSNSVRKLHDGAILCSASWRGRLLTGGDDGRVVATAESGQFECLFQDQKGRWIDHMATGPSGHVACSAGKQVFLLGDRAGREIFSAPSSVGGLALSSHHIAVAHYNGVTVCELDDPQRASQLTWKGSHQLVTFSPDEKILVSAMREPTLHAWQVSDGKDLAMPGYPIRVQSFDWTASARYLATSGSDRLVLLTFQSDDNPLARTPLLLAPYKALVARVACHPRKEIVAVGFDDGLVLLVRVPDGAEIIIKTPDASKITALEWNPTGTQLAVASENQYCRIFRLT